MSGILWLASYPKSGNTWLRVAFANLLQAGEMPARLNELGNGPNSADRRLFDDLVGYSASDLTPDEVDAIRPDVYRHSSAGATKPLLCKAHDAFTRLPDGQPLFPPDATAGVIYVIRNPLDVCVSYAHHMGRDDYDGVAADMADPNFAIAAGQHWMSTQLRQRLLSWSEHVLSWVNATGVPVHVVRYEDMHAAPVETLAAAAAFAGISADPATVARAVAFSAIEELQRQEQEHGFIERAAPARPFFRKGKIGSWREALSDIQAARIVGDHRDVMRRFGYLTDAGEPAY